MTKAQGKWSLLTNAAPTHLLQTFHPLSILRSMCLLPLLVSKLLPSQVQVKEQTLFLATAQLPSVP